MSEPKALIDPQFINTEPDLVVIGKEMSYIVHRITLVCLSPYFQKVFLYDCQKNSNGFYRIDMSGVRPDVLLEILKYASYGRLDVNEKNVSELLITCDKYNIRAIIQICQHFLRHNLNEINCFETYLLSHYYNCDELKQTVTQYIVSNQVITVSDGQLDHHLILKRAELWTKSNQFNESID